jgi:phosphatidylinositol-3-phosphatase
MKSRVELRRYGAALVGLGLTLLLAACSGHPSGGQRTQSVRPDNCRDGHELKLSAPSAHPPSAARSPAKRASEPRSHIVVLVMENKEVDSVIGSKEAPYTTALACKYTFLSQSYAITHPSLPNYLALMGGSTFGVTTDCTTCYQKATNLVDELEAKGISWKAYMQGMPAPCFQGAQSGQYVKKHDPFMYFNDIRNDAARCHRVLPMTQLMADLRRGSLPDFAFISPDLCADTHDCPVSTGDRFLKKLMPRLLPALGHNGIAIITYDEGESDAGCCGVAKGGHIATIIAGPGAARHTTITATLDHYSILRLIEDNWNLGRLRLSASKSTPSLEGFGR